MKKSTKLLSVILAMVMILSSLTMIASASKPNYKTGLTDGNYSPDGAVTRLDTNTRLTMIFDYLDTILAGTGIKDSLDIKIATLNYDITSISGICSTVDSLRDLLGNGLLLTVTDAQNIKKAIDNSGWEKGMQYSESSAQSAVYIGKKLLSLVASLGGPLKTIIDRGSLELGGLGDMVVGIIKLDLSQINYMIGHLPETIKGFIFPLLLRADANAAERKNLTDNLKGDGGVETVLNTFVQGIFSKPMNWTSYRELADGTPCTADGNTAHGATVALPTKDDGLANYYVKGTDKDGNTVITRYKYDLKTAAWAEDGTFVKEEEVPGTGVYIYADPNGGENLKYYTAGEDGYFLPNAKDIAFNLMSGDSAATLLYKFAPKVFEAMAPVVLNGSVKKLLGELFGAEYTYIGDVKNGKYVAAKGHEDVTVPNDTFFTQAQGAYLWEWSDYKVIDGTHYYRFEDQIFVADTSNVNPFFDGVINWDYKISDDFINEFIPSVNGAATGNSAAGYSTVLQGLNKFLVKLANTVLKADVLKTAALTNGDNTNLVANIKSLAQTIVKVSPESIFGSNYADADRYYNLMMSNDNQEVLVGIACTVVDLLMPQMILPDATQLKGQKLGAVLAAVVRELATQLVPNKDYDALIYSDYNSKTLLTGKDNSYWLDVLLTIGTDIGYKYLTNLADMGEDQAAWAGANYQDGAVKYTEAMLTVDGVRLWEARVDYIIDWALTVNIGSYTWNFAKMVDTTGLTVDMATVQDPWVKLSKIIKDLLPIEDIINTDYSNDKWLESVLRDNFVLAIADLDLAKIVNLLNIPEASVLRKDGVFQQIFNVVKDLINGLLHKTLNADLIDASTGFTRIDTIFNQTNLANAIKRLVEQLYVAVGSGDQNNCGIVDVALPIVNFFVGWKTDAQTYSNPSIITSVSNYLQLKDGNYAFDVSIINNSAGMLLKHKTADGQTKVDSPYKISVESITVNGAEKSSAAFDVDPFNHKVVNITGSSSADDLLAIVVAYKFHFKDESVSETQLKKFTYVPASNKVTPVINWAPANVKATAGLFGAYTVVNFKGYTNTINAVCTDPDLLKSTVNDIYITWDNDRDTATQYKDTTFGGFNATYLSSTGAVEARRDTWLGADKDDNPDSIQTDNPLKLNENVVCTEDDTTLKDGEVALKSGTVIALGSASTKQYGEHNGKTATSSALTCNFGNLYYCDLTEINKLVDAELDEARNESDYTAESWATYWNAFEEAALMAKAPISIANFATEYSGANINAKITALQNAIKGLQRTTVSSTDQIRADIGKALNDFAVDTNGADHNFQDYNLFEYWAYERMRNRAREINKSLIAPTRPQGYIAGCWFTQAEIEAIGTSEGGKKGAAIVDAMTMPTQAELDAFDANPWEAPVYDEVEIQDTTKRFEYYYNFMTPTKVDADKTFLNREIEAANKQNYVEAEYSKDSWAAYQAALANATTVSAKADALPSEVFNAKYDLMRTQNELLLKSKSAKETGAYATLEELAAKAEAIFANPTCYDVVTAGMTEADAYAALIKALGYKYTDAEGNETILFSRSAYDYMAYDRETNSNNMAKVATAEAALKAAIDNFECNIKLETTDNVTAINPGQFVIDGITPGSITSMEDLLTHVQATNADATLVTTVSKANDFGTGAKVEVQFNGSTVATYNVVIYGDVNGDGAIDGFDAIELDLANSGSADIDGVYATAADTDGNGIVDSADYASVIAEVQCTSAIAQTK